MNYSDYLASTTWFELRWMCMMRDSLTCRVCGDKATEVHHVAYPGSLEDDRLANVISLCSPCHRELHNAQ